MKITFSGTGDFKRTEQMLKNMAALDISRLIESQAQRGVQALSAATPEDSGRAADSWGYEIKKTNKSVSIIWTNSDVENGYPVAIMIQYGHGTGTGGYIQGIDYINPAMRPIFDRILQTVWEAVKSA